MRSLRDIMRKGRNNVRQTRHWRACCARKKERDIMTKQNFHSADIKNANKGTNGTNITYDKKQENRGKQLNPNQKKNKQEEQEVKCRKKF